MTLLSGPGRSLRKSPAAPSPEAREAGYPEMWLSY